MAADIVKCPWGPQLLSSENWVYFSYLQLENLQLVISFLRNLVVLFCLHCLFLVTAAQELARCRLDTSENRWGHVSLLSHPQVPSFYSFSISYPHIHHMAKTTESQAVTDSEWWSIKPTLYKLHLKPWVFPLTILNHRKAVPLFKYRKSNIF